MTTRQLPTVTRAAAAAAAAAAILFWGAPAAALTKVHSHDPFTESLTNVVHTSGQIPIYDLDIWETTRSLPRFDPALGVLYSAQLRMISEVTATGAVAAATDSRFPNQTVVGRGSGQAVFSGPGFSQAAEPLPHAATCQTSASQLGCAAVATEVSRFALARPIDLAAHLARPGNETFFVSLVFLVETEVSKATTQPSSYVSILKWEVTDLLVLYEYMRHATPSFAKGASQMTLDLDFGSVIQGDPGPALAFSIFDNSLAPHNSVGFRLVDAVGSGDTSALTTNVATGLDFGAGSTAAFSAFLDSSNVGDFSATYAFGLQETGAGVGHRDYALTLNLRGQVLAPPAAVPEPHAWALMIGGFGAAGAVLRRRRLPEGVAIHHRQGPPLTSRTLT